MAPRLGSLKTASGASANTELKIDFSFLTTSSVLFDAVYLPSGAKSVAALKGEGDAIHFTNEAYKHCKAIAASGEGVELARLSYQGGEKTPNEKKCKGSF